VKRTFTVRCNDEVEAQRRRWTFYEAIRKDNLLNLPERWLCKKLQMPGAQKPRSEAYLHGTLQRRG